MSRIIFFLCLAVLPMTVSAAGADYQRADSLRVMELFQKAKSVKAKGMAAYMVFFARQLKGVPYVGKTLEKNREERLVVNLRQLDCTTYVETVLALSRCMAQCNPTFANYCANLRLVRYKDGKVAYTARQHYFTYWIQQNVRKGIVADIQSPNPPYSAVQTVKADYMTTHLAQYPMLKDKPAWVRQIAAMEKSITGLRVRYIPKSAVDNGRLMRQTVRDGDIIAIITSKAGLEIAHLGIAVWHADGLHLLNASSIHHRVVEEPMLLRTYLYKQKSRLGIRTVRAG